MASVRFENDRGREGWRIRFRDKNKRQRSIWLGNVAEHVALEIKAHVEHLVVVSKDGRPPEPATTKWLGRIDDSLRDKLAHVGLVESTARQKIQEIALGEWLEMYISERKDVKESTRETYRKAQDNLIDYFGAKTRLRDISPADAKRWRIWLKTEGNRRTSKSDKSMAEETVRRRTGKVKQFFREAVERGYCDQNPFESLPSTSRGNAANQFFVPQEWIESCIENCPDQEWRTILALCRYGGLRCPSELLRLRWQDVDLPGGRMVIHADKTEHHATGGVRVCPIFPELRPYLEAAWDAADENTEFLINRYRSVEQNLRTTFEKIIKRSGLAPWPRLFQNLRASRETELMANWPAKDVASWLGNSVPVAMRHYAMATDESFQAAAELSPSGGHIGGHISDNQGGSSRHQPQKEKAEIPEENGLLMTSEDARELVLVGDEGLEPPTPSV